MLEITITATRRPEILRRTLTSFYRHLFKQHPTRVIINVDPVGDDMSSWDVAQIPHEFTKEVIMRCPKIPSFPDAFKWCWESTTSDLVFHLEDDWELLHDVDLSKMIDVMNGSSVLQILRLPMWKTTDVSKNWSVFFPWNGEYFECPRNHNGSLGFCGHPSLLKGSFVRFCAEHLDPTRNPEKQIKWRNSKIGPGLLHYKFGVFAEPYSSESIRDIGREWRIKNGWGKKGNREHFVEWTRVAT